MGSHRHYELAAGAAAVVQSPREEARQDLFLWLPRTGSFLQIGQPKRSRENSMRVATLDDHQSAVLGRRLLDSALLHTSASDLRASAFRVTDRKVALDRE